MSGTGSSGSRGMSLSRDNGAPLAHAAVLAAFGQLAGRPLPEEPALARHITTRQLARGEVLFAAGAVDRHVHVVLSGFLTLTYPAPDGTAWVKGFVPEQVPFACVSCLDGDAAPFGAYAGTASIVASVPYAELERRADASMDWQRAMRNAFKRYGQRKEKREMELLMLTAEERYTRFLHEMPAIAAQLKQHEIASYIRVTPVSLSRIRRRMGATGTSQASMTPAPRRTE